MDTHTHVYIFSYISVCVSHCCQFIFRIGSCTDKAVSTTDLIEMRTECVQNHATSYHGKSRVKSAYFSQFPLRLSVLSSRHVFTWHRVALLCIKCGALARWVQNVWLWTYDNSAFWRSWHSVFHLAACGTRCPHRCPHAVCTTKSRKIRFMMCFINWQMGGINKTTI